MGWFGSSAAWAGKAAVGATKFVFVASGKTLVFLVPEKQKAKFNHLTQMANKVAGKVKGEHQCVGDRCKKRLKGADQLCFSCAKKLKSEVDNSWKKISNNSLYDGRGRNRNTVKYEPCGCNMLNTFHNCGPRNGERLRSNIRNREE